MPFKEAQRSQWNVMDTMKIGTGNKEESSLNSSWEKAFCSLGALEKLRV